MSLRILTLLLLATALAHSADAVDLSFVGSHYNIGGTFFPGAGPNGNPNRPYVVVPWRTSSTANVYSAVDEDGQRYYGRDGYAVFGTRFDYPSAYVAPGSSAAPGDPIIESLFPNLIDLPDFVVDSQVLASRVVGGYGYALIDDPTQTAGIRNWAWGESQSPQSFGQAPYVQLGILDGWDQFGNDPANPNPEALPAGRWGFAVGEGTPAAFRLGVMSDGTDNANFVPEEIFLAQVTSLAGGAVLDFVSSGTITANRFVDMHFFDITDAQPGDLFAVGVKAQDGSISFGNSGLAGFSFDILPAAPGLAGDYNTDGVVDAADYTVWRDGGAPDNGPAGYTLWAENYGSTLPLPLSVPEPSTALLAALAMVGAVRRRVS